MCVGGVWVCPRYPPTEKQNGARLPVQSWSPSALPLWVGSKGASFALNRSVVERKEAKTVFDDFCSDRIIAASVHSGPFTIKKLISHGASTNVH